MRAEDATDRVDRVLAHRPLRCTYLFTPASIGDATGAVRASLAGVPVRLAPDAIWPEGLLERLAAHFLYAPDLEVPIEPFATLAQTIARGRGPDLWLACREELGRDFFVDVEGRVSLSERWARRGLFFGTVHDDLDTFEASELWQDLAAWRQRIFADVMACATCAHFPVCGGFWLADGSDEAVCRGWQTAFQLLTDAWRAHRDELTSDEP